jgi:hypothetical protein
VYQTRQDRCRCFHIMVEDCALCCLSLPSASRSPRRCSDAGRWSGARASAMAPSAKGKDCTLRWTPWATCSPCMSPPPEQDRAGVEKPPKRCSR